MGSEGPKISQSRIPTRPPNWRRLHVRATGSDYAKARFAAMVDLPTPPLQLRITKQTHISPAHGDNVADVLQVLDLVVSVRHHRRGSLRADVDVDFHGIAPAERPQRVSACQRQLWVMTELWNDFVLLHVGVCDRFDVEVHSSFGWLDVLHPVQRLQGFVGVGLGNLHAVSLVAFHPARTLFRTLRTSLSLLACRIGFTEEKEEASTLFRGITLRAAVERASIRCSQGISVAASFSYSMGASVVISCYRIQSAVVGVHTCSCPREFFCEYGCAFCSCDGNTSHLGVLWRGVCDS